MADDAKILPTDRWSTVVHCMVTEDGRGNFVHAKKHYQTLLDDREALRALVQHMHFALVHFGINPSARNPPTRGIYKRCLSCGGMGLAEPAHAKDCELSKLLERARKVGG